jgi:multiple sugar transport system ATP-binding protein
MQLGSTMIYVTHDQIEALTLADRVAVMHGGVIQQLAPPKEIYQRPINRFVAGFVGSPSMNFIEGRLSAVNGSLGIALPDGSTVSVSGYRFAGTPGDGRPAVLGVRPEQIELKQPQAGAASLPVTVSVVEPMGSDMLVWGSTGKDTLSVRVGPDEPINVGDRITAHFMPAQASLFDAETGNRL